MRVHEDEMNVLAPRRRTPPRRWPMGDRSGQVLALFAVLCIPLLAMLALGIDWGMLLTARDEAQRAADAGALAGAAKFQGCSDAACQSLAQAAEDAAVEFASRNHIRDTQISPAEVTVQVMPSERKVRVFVDRDGVPTFFAHMLGITVKPIGAVAAAMVSSGGTGQCVMPFFGPDLWREPGDLNQVPETGEEDLWNWDDDGEDLTPDPEDADPPSAPEDCTAGVDCYQPLQSDGSGTGYGSNLRDGEGTPSYVGDVGRHLVIKAGSKGGNPDSEALGTMIAPGNFQLWSPPIPDKEGVCDPENPTYATGGNDLRKILTGEIECTCPVSLSETQSFDPETGQKWGPVTQGLEQRMADDEYNTTWDEETEQLTCSINGNLATGSDCYGSSRVVPIALSNPSALIDLTGQSAPVAFNNFARIYLEAVEGNGNNKIVWARFLGFVAGAGGPVTGELIEYLRLVE